MLGSRVAIILPWQYLLTIQKSSSPNTGTRARFVSFCSRTPMCTRLLAPERMGGTIQVYHGKALQDDHSYGLFLDSDLDVYSYSFLVCSAGSHICGGLHASTCSCRNTRWQHSPGCKWQYSINPCDLPARSQ